MDAQPFKQIEQRRKMKIRSIETFKINLPFRLAFGHSLASRKESHNLIVKVTTDDGTIGWGESIPRDYVTGEDINSAEEAINKIYVPALLNLALDDTAWVINQLQNHFAEFGLETRSAGASWCAIELAILDAAAKCHKLHISDYLGKRQNESINYGIVTPFAGQKALTALLLFYKIFGFKTVKIKVGDSIENDLARVRLCRKIMGEKTILRADANCAWTKDQALKAVEIFRPYNILSYEQPLPADDLAGLKDLTERLPEDIVVDESLCTIAQARHLAQEKICNAFNIRISKVGGWLASQNIVNIARQTGTKCHLGAQVGESGILSAAGRAFALIHEPFANYEGSDNALLLKQDLTNENLTVKAGGRGDLSFALANDGKSKKYGLGVTVDANRLLQLSGI